MMVLAHMRCMLLSYPDFELIERIEAPNGLHTGFKKGAAIGADYYALFDFPPGLWKFSGKDRKWTQVIENFQVDDGGYLGAFHAASERTREEADRAYVARITLPGTAITFDPQTKETTTLELDNWGLLDPHAF